MNWKLNKTIRIKKRKENKRKEIITIIMDWAQFLSLAWSKWNGGFFFKKPCEVGWAVSKKKKKKKSRVFWLTANMEQEEPLGSNL